jgi:hypothetical protein
MPRREILTATERLQLLAFPEDVGELIRLLAFTKADLAFVRQHRGDHNRLGVAVLMSVWRQAIFRLATTKIPDTCCNFFLSSLVSLLLAVPKRSAEGAKRRPCQSPFLCGTCLQLQPDAPK